MTTEVLLNSLPRYEGKKQLVKGQQSVKDIMTEILTGHKHFAQHYDQIAMNFAGGSAKEIGQRLVKFCQDNIRYREEGEAAQTVKSPAAILHQRVGDCKHYASFIGGVLDALNRKGMKINWHYRFASYHFWNRDPGHVFIVLEDHGREIWLDPTPGAAQSKPTYQINKKPNTNKMALYRISGIDQDANQLLETYHSEEQIYWAIQTLLKYGVMTVNGKVHPNKMIRLQGKISPAEFILVLQSYQILHSAAIGGLFSTIWRGVKKVTLAAPRIAFLGLLEVNAFGYATKLYNAVYNPDKTYTSFKEKIKTLWQDRFGGDWTKLENAIRNGHSKRAIMGSSSVGAAAAAVPAWVATASAVIAAVMPLVNAFLKQQQQTTGINYEIDPTTGQPYSGTGTGTSPLPHTVDPSAVSFTDDPITWVKENPLKTAAIALGGYFLYKKIV